MSEQEQPILPDYQLPKKAASAGSSMVLHVLRALFILLMASVGWFFVKNDPELRHADVGWLRMVTALIIGVFILSVDILAPRKKLAVFSGTFLGLLVGICIAFAFSFLTSLLVDQAVELIDPTFSYNERDQLVKFINLLIGVVSCYLSISFILQTKDDFRFVIPYVEFSKQTKGARAILLDTSVLIDGRITDVVETGILESQLIVPQFVIDELHQIADSADKLKRNRGRRGLDIVQKLRANPRAEVAIYDVSAREAHGVTDVDQKLVYLAQETSARIMTNDFNLNKVARLRGVDVININDLAGALKPVVLPGEKMTVRLIKAGDEAGQGVGYLEDGTMVVVEQGRQHLNEIVELIVTSALQTKAGKMIFGRMTKSGPATV